MGLYTMSMTISAGLKLSRDQDKNILKVMKYNYAGQPEN